MGTIDEALLDEKLAELERVRAWSPRVISKLEHVAVVALIVAAACGQGGGGQSLREGMQILCASDEEAGVENVAPAERLAAKSKWIDARLKNREARDVFERIADLPPAQRAQLLVTLVDKAKLDRCDGLAAGGSGLPPGVQVPELGASATGAMPLDDAAPMFTVVVSDTEVVIEGDSIVPVANGSLPAYEREGGGQGLMIPKVREMAKALVAAAPPGGRPLEGARLLLTPTSTYQVLLQLMYSIKAGGVKRFDIVARRDGKAVVVPIELPEARPASASVDDLGKPRDLGMIVAVSKDKMIIFSISGLEGTIQSPKLATVDISSAEIARVQAALVDIHSRHTDERRVVVMFDGATPMQLVTETLAAVRAKPDGSPLFTDVMLSAGFE